MDLCLFWSWLLLESIIIKMKKIIIYCLCTVDDKYKDDILNDYLIKKLKIKC